MLYLTEFITVLLNYVDCRTVKGNAEAQQKLLLSPNQRRYLVAVVRSALRYNYT